MLSCRRLFLTLFLGEHHIEPVQLSRFRSCLMWAVAIHGGAGELSLSQEEEKENIEYLTNTLKECTKLLSQGASALDVVEAAIVLLENASFYDAGKGSVFDEDGKHVLEASIMDGSNNKCGAASGLLHIKNPIVLARKIMENTPHVMLIGEGAERFAKLHNLTFVENGYFSTERAKREWEEVRRQKTNLLANSAATCRQGTVGCVALDIKGNLAAGTSTGGTNNKMAGRVGDSPIIGAGTFADKQVAVSCTGRGELFIQNKVAYQMAARMRFAHESLREAASNIIYKELPYGAGGLIATDKNGTIVTPFTTKGMFRGAANAHGLFRIKIWPSEGKEDMLI